jgi:hypothetical protein
LSKPIKDVTTLEGLVTKAGYFLRTRHKWAGLGILSPRNKMALPWKNLKEDFVALCYRAKMDQLKTCYK